MKKLVSLIVLIFMLGGLLVGCEELPEIFDKLPDSQDETPEAVPEEKPEETPDGKEEPKEESKEEGKQEENEQKPLPEVGTLAGYLFRDLTLTTIDGEEINTADLRGRIIIFNVWATWCPPCKAELPDFSRIADEYADDVVVIATHTYDSGMKNVPLFVNMNYSNSKIIFAYDNEANDAYLAAGGEGYVPQTAIIGRDGVILYSGSGGLSYDWLVNFLKSHK